MIYVQYKLDTLRFMSHYFKLGGVERGRRFRCAGV